MYAYSKRSLRNLSSCQYPLQKIFFEGIKRRDISIISGYRDQEEQDALVLAGKSRLWYPNSKHNHYPSRAVDAIPYPTTSADWKNREFWIEWSSWVKGLSEGLGIEIVSGYDWDDDYDLSPEDQTFWDGPHFELED